MPKTPLKIFMLLNGLFQKHIKCFRVFGNIFYTSYEYSSKCKYSNDLNSVLRIFLKNVHYFWFGAKPLPKYNQHYLRPF